MEDQQLTAEGYSFDLESSVLSQCDICDHMPQQRLTIFDQLRDIYPDEEMIVLVMLKRNAVSHHE